MIVVTELATKKVLEVIEAEGRQGQSLRVSVHGGGTAGAEFALNFVEPGAALPDDTVIEVNGFRVHVDAASAPYLRGATIDYVEGLAESGFKVDAPNARPPRPSGPVAEAIQKVIDERINPGVAGHGGSVSLVGLQEDVAYVQLSGGCQGCGMADVTLKHGIEAMIREAVPQITRILDVTDHAGGRNPYYQPAK